MYNLCKILRNSILSDLMELLFLIYLLLNKLLFGFHSKVSRKQCNEILQEIINTALLSTFPVTNSR